MAQAFNVGDTVQLKSGGPIMTVTSVQQDTGSVKVWCVWFDKTEPKRGNFPPEALEKT